MNNLVYFRGILVEPVIVIVSLAIENNFWLVHDRDSFLVIFSG